MILSMNTSTIRASMALMEESGTVMAEYSITPGSKSFKGFMPALDDLLNRSSIKKEHIEGLIVATGPGSFTGLRVGLSTAKGLCRGLKIPIIGVSGLEALANQLPYSIHPICSIVNAKSGEVFAALFKGAENGKIIRIREDTCLPLENLSSFIEGRTLFLGTDFDGQVPEIAKTCGQKVVLAPAHLWNLRASTVGAVGLERFRQQDYDELQDLVPSYLRPPDIRRNPYPILKNEPTVSSCPGEKEH